MQHPGNTYVLGDGNNLPFSDNSMDTVICRHVVEHVNDPAHFVNELQRVGKNGYLEWPSIYSELVHGGFGDQEYLAKNINAIDRKIVKKLKHGNGTRGHKWFIVPVEDTLFCVGKVQAIFPLYLIYGRFTKLLQNGSKLGFGCKFPKTSAITWTRQHPVKVEVLTQKDSIIAKSLNNEYRLTDQKKWIARNFANTPECIKELDEYKLRCPSCHRGKLKLQEVDTLHCENCQLSYPVINGVPVLLDNSDV